MNKKKTIILFGGISPEHEVSIITGLQVVEKIDRNKFIPFAIKQGQDGRFYYYKNLKNRKQFLKIRPVEINFGFDKNGSYFVTSTLIKIRKYIDCAYLCFHGGGGESGQIQGFLDVLNIPYTSSNVEGGAVSMNKVLTKEVLDIHGIENVQWCRVFDNEINTNVDNIVKNIKKELGLPVIIKPTHLGSSIGINVAKTEIELKKYLLEATHIDSEILVEKFIKKFIEFNISVRKVGEEYETSEIERPVSKDEILSFADKYQRGGKKTGGMASLSRELPAKINTSLKKKIEGNAIKAFRVLRLKGMVRIDFMYSLENNKLYLTEVNPIPGSMAFYLWEASGVAFKDQITDLVNVAMIGYKEKKTKQLVYESDIVNKFVNQ